MRNNSTIARALKAQSFEMNGFTIITKPMKQPIRKYKKQIFVNQKLPFLERFKYVQNAIKKGIKEGDYFIRVISDRYGHLGLKTDDLFKVERCEVKEGDFIVATFKKKYTCFGFATFLGDKLMLDLGNDDCERYYDMSEIKIEGKIVGYVKGKLAKQGFLDVLPLKKICEQ